MKWIAAIALILWVSICDASAQNNGKSLPDGSYYTCTMNPEVHNDAPGSCPVCGMDLVKTKPLKPKRKPVPANTKKPVKSENIRIEEIVAPKDTAVPLPRDSTLQPAVLETPAPEPAPAKHPPIDSIRPPQTIRVDLFVGRTRVNFTGKYRFALSINGQVPAPTLHFTEGDTAEIYVHNLLGEETSIHWHGLILPNRYDGVPYLTTAPIRAGETQLFRFPLVQNGTYWYHSHTGTQEQRGMYGALVIHKRAPERAEDKLPETTLVLSDWADENPKQIHRSLHNATDWYAIKKGSTQDYGSALRQGYFPTKIRNEWIRQLPMDVSDVAYDLFLANGKASSKASAYKKGDRVRLRIVNGSASTYFWLTWAGGKISVIANDGMDVEPVEVDRMLIAVAETYDVVVTIPEDGSYEFRATAEDRTKFASLFLGAGSEITAPELPKLQYFEGMKMMNGMMKMDGSMDDMGMNMSLQKMDMNSVMYPEVMGGDKKKSTTEHTEPKGTGTTLPKGFKTLNYAMLRSTRSTVLPEDWPLRTMHWELTGTMSRYVWTIDHHTVSESDKIMIRHGEKLRIILYNGSMMRHPMHLHGHFFRVLNKQGDYAPLKNVLDIMPMETDTIEFAASETEGDWFFHCHILYHMMSGMGRIFSYENSVPNPELPKNALRKVYQDDRRFHSMAHIGLESNGSDGEIMLGNTRWFAQTEWRLGLHDMHGYESESHIGRYLGKYQFFAPYVGWDYRYRSHSKPETNLFGQENSKDQRRAFCAGFGYTLPMFLILDARVDHTGHFRVQFRREDLALTPRLRAQIMWNTDREWMAGARWILTKYWSLSSHYDSDMGIGVGVSFTY